MIISVIIDLIIKLVASPPCRNGAAILKHCV